MISASAVVACCPRRSRPHRGRASRPGLRTARRSRCDPTAPSGRGAGSGGVTYSTIPLQFGTDTNWKSVSLNSTANGILWHALGLKTDGSLVEFGFGPVAPQGRVLQATPLDSSTPWSTAIAGGTFNVGIRTDGTLWTWGDNNVGQLGLGDTQPRSAPTQVGTDTTWVDVSAGADFAVARKADGSLWGWGNNDTRQLGLVGRQKYSPTPLGTAHDWGAIAAGDGTLALKTDGTLWSLSGA